MKKYLWIVKVTDSLTLNLPPSSTNDLSSKIFLSPNPTTGFISIETSQIIDHIDLFNLLGEKVPVTVNCQLGTVDCRPLPPGIYILQAYGDGKIWRGKIIKE